MKSSFCDRSSNQKTYFIEMNNRFAFGFNLGKNTCSTYRNLSQKKLDEVALSQLQEQILAA